jgi:DNA-binding NarL/FixJ family response regulator
MTKTRQAASAEVLATTGSAALDALRAASFALAHDEYCVVSAPFEPEAGFLGLTAAEVEVAKLAISGLSNRAIAERRGSSVRTVANQMAAVLQKLGATSRIQVAARLGERAR